MIDAIVLSEAMRSISTDYVHGHMNFHNFKQAILWSQVRKSTLQVTLFTSLSVDETGDVQHQPNMRSLPKYGH
jgi:hypothetical protein